MADWLEPGRYRISFSAPDRAGNRPVEAAGGVLLVKPHKERQGRVVGGGRRDSGRRDAAQATPGARLTAEVRRLVELLTASGH